MKIISETTLNKVVEANFAVTLINGKQIFPTFSFEVSAINYSADPEKTVLKAFLESISIQNGFFKTIDGSVEFFMKSSIFSVGGVN